MKCRYCGRYADGHSCRHCGADTQRSKPRIRTSLADIAAAETMTFRGIPLSDMTREELYCVANYFAEKHKNDWEDYLGV